MKGARAFKIRGCKPSGPALLLMFNEASADATTLGLINIGSICTASRKKGGGSAPISLRYDKANVFENRLACV